jgi:hypothetical protein
MDEAFGDAEMAVARSILGSITAGNEEGAKEEACNAVINFLSTNGLNNSLRDEEAIWAALMRNVFPKAPTPELNPFVQSAPLPTSSKEFFYAMCNRYRRVRMLEDELESETEKMKLALVAMNRAEDEFTAWLRVDPNRPFEKDDPVYKRLNRAALRMNYFWHQHIARTQQLKDELYIARQETTVVWTGLPDLRPRRQGALGPYTPEWPESSDDEEEPMQE